MDYDELLPQIDIIKDIYKKHILCLMDSGSLPFYSTEKGFWGFTPVDEAFDLFKKIKLDSFSRFVDLGGGDGRVSVVASLFTSSVSIESDKKLCGQSVKIVRKLSQDLRKSYFNPSNIELINDDFINHDLSGYDICFINPDKPFSEGTEKKLKDDFDGLLIVYGCEFLPITFKLHSDLSNQLYRAKVYYVR